MIIHAWRCRFRLGESIGSDCVAFVCFAQHGYDDVDTHFGHDGEPEVGQETGGCGGGEEGIYHDDADKCWMSSVLQYHGRMLAQID